MPRQFQGHIDLDVRDSTPDWSAFLGDRAPQGAPNVLVVLYDDTGCAAWSPYGGRINMPTMQRLADNGLTYTQWHTTALCSPTRSTFLTGRNHHLNGFATISESSTGFPGYSSHIPPENATMATVLRDAGWSTYWVGKNHNVPVDEWTMGGSKKNWPLGPVSRIAGPGVVVHGAALLGWVSRRWSGRQGRRDRDVRCGGAWRSALGLDRAGVGSVSARAACSRVRAAGA
jgi:arylsulfatase A-like enzyme